MVVAAVPVHWVVSELGSTHWQLRAVDYFVAAEGEMASALLP